MPDHQRNNPVQRGHRFLTIDGVVCDKMDGSLIKKLMENKNQVLATVEYVPAVLNFLLHENGNAAFSENYQATTYLVKVSKIDYGFGLHLLPTAAGIIFAAPVDASTQLHGSVKERVIIIVGFLFLRTSLSVFAFIFIPSFACLCACKGILYSIQLLSIGDTLGNGDYIMQ